MKCDIRYGFKNTYVKLSKFPKLYKSLEDLEFPKRSEVKFNYNSWKSQIVEIIRLNLALIIGKPKLASVDHCVEGSSYTCDWKSPVV